MNILNHKGIHRFDGHTPEESIAAYISAGGSSAARRRQLTGWLPRQHVLYRGRSANEVVRIRGFLLQSFSQTGLPEKALPFVLEELESGRNAYLVAAAAIALRGLPAPRPALTSYLLKGIENIKSIDDAISFASYRPEWPLKEYTTALAELLKTLAWMGESAKSALPALKALLQDTPLGDRPRRCLRQAIEEIEKEREYPDESCCRELFPVSYLKRRRPGREIKRELPAIGLEDQDGQTVTYHSFFSGKPSVVVFFYTRCDNFNKCSLTMTRLGRLQKALEEAGLKGAVKTAAITYDPIFDRPFRLRSYATARGVTTDEDNRVFRAPSGTPVLLEYFGSEVNYIASVVNQHATELFVLDEKGAIRKSLVHLQWEIPAVIAELRGMVEGRRKTANWMGNFFSPLLSWLVVIFPKCPVCWATYLSFLGITNMYVLKWTYWLLPLFVGLLIIHLWSLYKMGRVRNGYLPFFLSLSGIACIVLLGYWLKIRPASYAGLGLVLMGSFLSQLKNHRYRYGHPQNRE
ncbi:MAG TPA: SCO family protein [Puia sp.]|nr:SCO family protein [Puia sp.]